MCLSVRNSGTRPNIVSKSSCQYFIMKGNGDRTINLNETGAFRASAISWALALTLPFLVRIVLIASLKLF